MKKQKNRTLQNGKAGGVIHISLTEDELKNFERLKSIKLCSYSTLANYLFMKKFPGFVEKNKFGIFIPYTENRDDEIKILQFRVNENTLDELNQICRAGVTKTAVARMLIIPALQEELEKYKELI